MLWNINIFKKFCLLILHMISYATQTFSTQENYAASFMTVYTVHDRFIPSRCIFFFCFEWILIFEVFKDFMVLFGGIQESRIYLYAEFLPSSGGFCFQSIQGGSGFLFL